jgi:BMFP domain-containing protein YqiC
MTRHELNPIHEYQNQLSIDILKQRISEMEIEERVRATSMSPMFSFWKEIQETLIASADEIARLKARIKELENVSHD